MKAPKLPGAYEVKSEVIINVSKQAVWNLLKEFGTVSDWAPSVTNSYYLGEKRGGVGTGRHCDIKGFGSIQEYVTEWHEGTGFIYNVTPLGPLAKAHSSWWITRIDDHKSKLEVTLSYDIRFGVFGKILHKLVMRSKLMKSLPETLESTKAHIENTQSREPIFSDQAIVSG